MNPVTNEVTSEPSEIAAIFQQEWSEEWQERQVYPEFLDEQARHYFSSPPLAGDIRLKLKTIEETITSAPNSAPGLSHSPTCLGVGLVRGRQDKGETL